MEINSIMNSENLIEFCSDLKKLLDKIDILRNKAICLYDDAGTELVCISADKKDVAVISDDLKLLCKEVYKEVYDVGAVLRRYTGYD